MYGSRYEQLCTDYGISETDVLISRHMIFELFHGLLIPALGYRDERKHFSTFRTLFIVAITWIIYHKILAPASITFSGVSIINYKSENWHSRNINRTLFFFFFCGSDLTIISESLRLTVNFTLTSSSKD